MIASVSGILTRERRAVPEPGVDVDGAADLLDLGLHHVHADAAAGHRRDRRGGREAGEEDQVDRVALGHLGGGSAVMTPLETALAFTLSASMPAPSSVISMTTWPPSCDALSSRRPSAGLPHVLAVVGALDAVVDRVADEVGQRIADRVDDRLVELGLLADHLEAHLLAARVGDLADDARHLRPRRADRLHAGLHQVLLQVARDQVEPLGCRHEVAVGGCPRPPAGCCCARAPARRRGS